MQKFIHELNGRMGEMSINNEENAFALVFSIFVIAIFGFLLIKPIIDALTGK